MIEILVTQEMRDEAQVKADKLGVLRNSIQKGQGNVIGFVGEYIAQQVLGGRLDSTTNYDLVLDDSRTVDVKSKKTTVEPKPHYECSVATYNTIQECDLYAFVRVLADLSKGWYLGYVTKKRFYDEAIYYKKGAFDPSNNFRFRAAAYNMPISDLDIVTPTP